MKENKTNRSDMGVWAVNSDLDAKRLSKKTHCLETFLVVRATSADEDADFVLLEGLLVLLKRANDALEGSCNLFCPNQ
jgi:hypothetical protein